MTRRVGRGGRDAAPRGLFGEAIAGAALLCDGLRMLGRERRLWGLSLVPIGFTALALALALARVARNADEIRLFVDGLLPVLEAGAWYTWLWVGPGRLLFWLLGWLLFLLTAALAAVLAVMLASVAASPFLDALSWRVEQITTGRVLESSESGAAALLRDAGRSIAGEARRMAFLLATGLLLFGAGLLIPGAHAVTGPAMLAVTILFLPLEFSGHALDRRQVPFADRRRWIGGHWPRMAGFGAAAFAACFVPGVNLVMMPVLVVAGTLLVIGTPPGGAGASVELHE